MRTSNVRSKAGQFYMQQNMNTVRLPDQRRRSAVNRSPIFWITCSFNFHYLELLSPHFKSIHKSAKTPLWSQRLESSLFLHHDIVGALRQCH